MWEDKCQSQLLWTFSGVSPTNSLDEVQYAMEAKLKNLKERKYNHMKKGMKYVEDTDKDANMERQRNSRAFGGRAGNKNMI